MTNYTKVIILIWQLVMDFKILHINLIKGIVKLKENGLVIKN